LGFCITGEEGEVYDQENEDHIIVKTDDILITKKSLRESIRKIKYYSSKLFEILLNDHSFREKLNFEF
jgi:hypothetical protein